MRDRMIRIVLPGALLGLFALLAAGTARWMSCTFDEPYHLTSGYAALRFGDFRLGPNHPPLIRMLTALPNTFDPDVRFPIAEEAYRRGQQFSTAFSFLFRYNELRPLLLRGRAVVVLLAVALGLLVYLWTLRIWGTGAALAALFLFVFEPNLMAHGSLVTTDMGVTLLFGAAVCFLWLLWQRLTVPRLLGFSAFFALAQTAKFTALALWPATAAVLAWRALARQDWETGGAPIRGRRAKLGVAAAILGVVGAMSVATVWGVYGFRYRMAPAAGMTYDTTEDREFRESERLLGERLAAIRVLPEGYVRGAAQIATWPQDKFYFAGRVRDRAVWYFYPAVLLVKTPTVVLVLFFAGAVLAVARRARLPEGWPALAVPPVSLLLAGVASGVNTGVRHLLPVFPFLLMTAGATAAAFVRDRRGRAVVAAFGVLAVAEFATTYPDVIAAFNLPSGGVARGDRWLLESDLDWGQDLDALKRWMDEHGVGEINLACHTNLPDGALGFRFRQLPVYPVAGERVDSPLLPGYVAVSAAVRRGLTLRDTPVADFYAPLERMTPVARVGGAIRVYYVERPWWPERFAPPKPGQVRWWR